MDPNSLYARGWRQGALLHARLPLTGLEIRDGAVQPVSIDCDTWLVASQDCDLARVTTDRPEAVVELRRVHEGDAPTDWGIRSRRLRLDQDRYLSADDPHLHVSPALLASVEQSRGLRLPEPRVAAVKTWLGLRYDRPAVPDALVPLARRISDEVAGADSERAMVVRDVLMQFDDSTTPPRYSLFAIIENPGEEEAIRLWLAEIARRVPRNLGIADQIEAATADETSFGLVESAYAADVTQMTWGGMEPEGAA